ncbi:MAG: hypothetical protein OEU86_01710 [Gammaproteobacteria bacterium]|nr:hypothetical protein [Gammaproteobacteria bacterium]
MIRIILLSISITFISACASSSHVMIGGKRTPIPMTEVKVYKEEPESFDVIATIDASSKHSLAFTRQQKLNTTLARLKKEAANLGANGIILGTIKEEKVSVPMTQPNGTTTYTTGLHKTAQATAIYVNNE